MSTLLGEIKVVLSANLQCANCVFVYISRDLKDPLESLDPLESKDLKYFTLNIQNCQHIICKYILEHCCACNGNGSSFLLDVHV